VLSNNALLDYNTSVGRKKEVDLISLQTKNIKQNEETLTDKNSFYNRRV